MSNWREFYNRKKDSYISVFVSLEEADGIWKIAKAMQEQKEGIDYQFQRDNKCIGLRFFTGLMGEYATWKVIRSWGLIDSIPSFNLEIGKSKDFDTPDLMIRNFNLGCKTCKRERSILVKTYSNYPEVICVLEEVKDKGSKIVIGYKVYICGIATREVLDMFSSIYLVDSDEVREREGTIAEKKGFTKSYLLFFKSRMRTARVNFAFIPRQYILKGSFYIEEVEENKIQISWCEYHTMGVRYLSETVRYPFNAEDRAKLRNIFTHDSIVIGWKITSIIEHIQSGWDGNRVELTLIDLRQRYVDYILQARLNPMGADRKFFDWCEGICSKEASAALDILYQKTGAKEKVDSVIRGYYSVISYLYR